MIASSDDPSRTAQVEWTPSTRIPSRASTTRLPVGWSASLTATRRSAERTSRLRAARPRRRCRHSPGRAASAGCARAARRRPIGRRRAARARRRTRARAPRFRWPEGRWMARAGRSTTAERSRGVASSPEGRRRRRPVASRAQVTRQGPRARLGRARCLAVSSAPWNALETLKIVLIGLRADHAPADPRRHARRKRPTETGPQWPRRSPVGVTESAGTAGNRPVVPSTSLDLR